MKILGIESSCDETAIAILSVEDGVFRVEHNLVSSQIDIHAKYGGVVPEIAARRHVDAIFPLLLEAGVPRDGSGIDVIAVTSGPGLVPALRVGVELANTLAWAWKKPLVGVNHLEGHIYSVWLSGSGEAGRQQATPTVEAPVFPALCLLVSGGHTELVLMRDHGVYERVGQTRDDAAGEAFDKVAKLLGLGYPGGPVISKCAKDGRADAIAFPRPMHDSGDFDFSFSGLKTAVAVYLKTQGQGTGDKGPAVDDICASFQEAVVDSLVSKTMAAVLKYEPASVILSGGVSANRRLREVLAGAVTRVSGSPAGDPYGVPAFFTPDMAFTGDNAAMIAAAGYFKAMRKEFADPLTLEADPNMRLV